MHSIDLNSALKSSLTFKDIKTRGYCSLRISKKEVFLFFYLPNIIFDVESKSAIRFWGSDLLFEISLAKVANCFLMHAASTQLYKVGMVCLHFLMRSRENFMKWKQLLVLLMFYFGQISEVSHPKKKYLVGIRYLVLFAIRKIIILFTLIHIGTFSCRFQICNRFLSVVPTFWYLAPIGSCTIKLSYVDIFCCVLYLRSWQTIIYNLYNNHIPTISTIFTEIGHT